MIICKALIFLLFFSGLWLIICSHFFHDKTFIGRRTLKRMTGWRQSRKDIWTTPIFLKVSRFSGRFVFLDQNTEEMLSRQLSRAGLSISARQFTARRYTILAFGILSIAICAATKFYIGILICALITGYCVLHQRELLTSKLKEKDEAITAEMPQFIRILCRNLRSNRDIYAALKSYRKVSGPVLGAELDILLSHMESGNVAAALQIFQNRLGTQEAFRLCSTLLEIDRGVDQTATLDYLADDMARQAKLNIQKKLSLRPAKMRRTYLPAVGVAVAMIMYVLVVFVIDQLNSLF